MSINKHWQRRRVTLVAILLVVLAGVMPAAGAVSAGRFSSVGDAVAGGVVDPKVAHGLEAHGSVDALVTLSYEGVLAQATNAAGGMRSPERAGAVLAITRPAYAAEKRAALAGVAGVRVLRDYGALPVSFVRITSEEALLAVANSPDTLHVQPNLKAELQLAESLPLIDQPAAQAAGYTGAGTAVAVLDTGVDYTRAAFGSCSSPGGACKVAYAHDFATDDGSLDDNGHGTNVSGIVLGVAPGTKILGLDVFSGAVAWSTDTIAAINWAVSTQATYNTRAMNLSIGDGSFNTTECSGSYAAAPFANARAVGILPVVAAGNDAMSAGFFKNGVSNPACAPGAVRVGAVYDSNMGPLSWLSCPGPEATAADKITCFSQGGPLLTLLAPGALITAAGLTQGGTSQATPHVAGAAAVLAAASPGATLTQIKNALTSTGPSITDSRTGLAHRRLDLWEAVQALVGTAEYMLTVSVTGSGEVTSVPAEILCPGSCSGIFVGGTSVVLTAAPSAGWAFSGWSGACSGTANPCTVSMTAARNVIATFVPGAYALSVTVNGSGEVTSVPAGISCPGSCSASYVSGTSVILTATPSAGWSFTGWSGACSGTTSPCTVSMSAARNVTATFSLFPSTTIGVLSGYYGTKGPNALYQASSKAYFTTTVSPNHAGSIVTVELWKRDKAAQTWVRLFTQHPTLGLDSSVMVFVKCRKLGTGTYAFGSSFAGDSTYAPSATNWMHFKIMA